MKRVYVSKVFYLFVLMILLQFVSAACVSPDQTIITLYAQNNSHAAIYNNTYNDPNANVPICYDEIFGQTYTGLNPWQCATSGPNNNVIGVYATSNSHVASGSTYGVCYGDLSCQIVSGSPGSTTCPVNNRFVMSISDLTNAHVAKDGSYGYKVCCQNNPSNPPVTLPEITSANFTGSDFAGVVRFANVADSFNLTIRSLNIPNGNKINITLYNSSNNVKLFADPLSVSVLNNQVNYRTNLTSLNATGNVNIGGKIYFNATYVNSSGSLVSDVRSDDLELVDYSITSTRWLDFDNDTTSRIMRGDYAYMLVNTTGLFGKRVNLTLYFKDSPNVQVRYYENEIINPLGELKILVNLTDEYDNAGLGNLVKGDRLLFIINNSANLYRISNDVIIDDVGVTELGCCEYITDQATCNARAPTIGGSCVIANINQSCNTNVLTKCNWNSLTSRCNTNVVRINALGQEDGSCLTSYTNVDQECTDGFRKISVTVTETPSTCSATPFCLDPCEGGVCTVPCRNVALLPFFSTFQLITSVGLIALMYFLFRRKL